MEGMGDKKQTMPNISVDDLTAQSLLRADGSGGGSSGGNYVVEKYQSRFSWLRDTKFLQDLENDSVDSEIIEEELSALQEEEVASSKRKKVVKFLQSNPVQILLCVVVLLDAVIVIAQILMDLNSVKNKLHRREDQLGRFRNVVLVKWPDELHSYEGHDYDHILRILEDHICDNMTDDQKERIVVKCAKNQTASTATSTTTDTTNLPVSNSHSLRMRRGDSAGPSGYDKSRDTSSSMTSSEITGTSTRDSDVAAEDSGGKNPPGSSKNGSNKKLNMQHHQSDPGISDTNSNTHEPLVDCTDRLHDHESHGSVGMDHVVEDEHDMLREIAHGLHFASVAMLGFLVLEDLVKIIAMGSDFFRHKLEIFDAIIITSSFVFDIIFLGGVTGEEGQKAAAVLVILLLWRIARVVDGILITVKQRQEFRIRLQKRSRRTAERKIDLLEEERHSRIRQIQSLKELCSRAGVREDDIEACTPRRGPRRVSTTMCALSSVARLSVSMTMSMSSGLFSMVDDGDDDTNASGRIDRRLSTNSAKTREYLGPCDAHDYSPKVSKKRSCLNNNSVPPPSPGLGTSTQEVNYLPKVDESSLEGHSDSSGGSPKPGLKSKLRNKQQSKSESSKKAKSKMSSPKNDKAAGTSKNSKSVVRTDDGDSRLSSPENSCGVQIVIDGGSEDNSICSQGEEEEESETRPFDSESFLTVEAAYDSDRRASGTSQIFLLSELR